MAFLAWSASGRGADFAAALGGEARTYFDLALDGRVLVPVRYALSALKTVTYLVQARPRAVIASSPPVFPGLIGLAYSKVSGAPLVLDTHPASFGLKGDRLTRLLMPVQKLVSQKAALNLVTVPELAGVVESWGGRALIVHEAPPIRPAAPRLELGSRPRVLFVTIFEPDEPVELALRAAALLPEVDFHVTGDLRKCPTGIAELAPPNVTFTGFLQGRDYYAALEAANVVISLTMRPQAVSRVGSEAVYLHRPLVITDTPAARDAFPDATLVDNTPEGTAEGVRRLLERYDELDQTLDRAKERQRSRWEQQMGGLSDSLCAERSVVGARQ